jgi:hypothetical protein
MPAAVTLAAPPEPAERPPMTEHEPDAVDVTDNDPLRNRPLCVVPVGQSIPIKSTFDPEDKVRVMSSRRVFDPNVTSVVFDEQFNC